MSRSTSLVSGALLIACTVSSTRAAAEWLGSSFSSDNWSDANNWLVWDRPGGGQNVSFYGTPARTSPYVDEDYTVGELHFKTEDDFTGASSSFTINGNSTLKIDDVYNITSKWQRINTHLRFNTNGWISNNVDSVNHGWLGVNTIDTNGKIVSVSPSSHGVEIFGAITGSGAVNVNGAGTLTLSGNNTFTGGLKITKGTVRYGGGPNLGGTDSVIWFSGSDGQTSTLQRYVSGTTVSQVYFESGEGSIAVPAGVTVTHSGALFGSGDFAKTEAGTLTLTNTGIQRTGRTFVREGILQLGAGATLPNASVHVFQGATLTYLASTTDTIGNLYGGGTVNLNSNSSFSIGTTGAANGNGEFSGSINALDATINKRGNGTLSLTGNNILTGTVNVVAGTMLYNNMANSTSAVGTANTIVQSGATLGGDGATDGLIDVKSGGTLEPSPGAGTTLTGSLSAKSLILRAGSTLRADIVAGGSDADNVSSESTLVLEGGTLALSTVFDQPINNNTRRTLLHADGNLTGKFVVITGMMMSNERRLAVTYDAKNVFVTSAVPGDADLDGNVAFADLLALAQHYGTNARTWSNGDFDGDGSVAFADLLALAQFYGVSGLSDGETSVLASDVASDWALAQSLVPEPTSIASLGLLLGVARRSRR